MKIWVGTLIMFLVGFFMCLDQNQWESIAKYIVCLFFIAWYYGGGIIIAKANTVWHVLLGSSLTVTCTACVLGIVNDLDWKTVGLYGLIAPVVAGTIARFFIPQQQQPKKA